MPSNSEKIQGEDTQKKRHEAGLRQIKGRIPLISTGRVWGGGWGGGEYLHLGHTIGHTIGYNDVIWNKCNTGRYSKLHSKHNYMQNIKNRIIFNLKGVELKAYQSSLIAIHTENQIG